ncbi:sensor histidine kinase [Histidinibacterium aquaticum]|uniref:histidine kinase n=1 Tax=Histidinibacterium aquaticum TaxID=2613962 RepID=A0A5J5GMP7_9RHOB|nr:ATP-binding protein [Histidinibacterium aquaticum]KAA9008963.1 hypothetical protein F3S47_06805 [Histidinibacterium aquaticum]
MQTADPLGRDAVDIRAYKRMDGADNPELTLRFVIVAGCAGALALGLSSYVILGIAAAYLVLAAIYARALNALPDRAAPGRWRPVRWLGLATDLIFYGGILYLWIQPVPLGEYTALLLLLMTGTSTAVVRASDSARKIGDLSGHILTGLAMLGAEIYRSQPTYLGLSFGVVLVVMALYVILIARKVARYRSERETARRAQVEAEKDRLLGQLTGGIAHDFNNQVTAILGNLELSRVLTDECEKGRAIAEAEAAAQRVARLTSDLLAYSRRSMLRPARVDPGRIAREVADLARQDSRTGLTLELETDLPSLMADAGYLRAALLHLLANAEEASAGKGADVELSVRRSEALGRDGVTFSVTDQGTGMSQEVRARATEPFFTTKPQGHGLGLSMAEGFARQSGGRLEIVWAEGEGTEVRLHLPLER